MSRVGKNPAGGLGGAVSPPAGPGQGPGGGPCYGAKPQKLRDFQHFEILRSALLFLLIFNWRAKATNRKTSMAMCLIRCSKKPIFYH